MNALLMAMTMSLGLLAASAGYAQAPAAAPAGTTAQCKDGSWYSGESKRGACRGHKGIQEWYGAAAGTAATQEAAPKKSRHAKKEAGTMAGAAAPAAPMTTAHTPASTAPQAAPTRPTTMPMSHAPAAAGAGAGQVWVNDRTRVYHCANDRYYGKTKHGEYMSEADAMAKGNHPAHGKRCTQ